MTARLKKVFKITLFFIPLLLAILCWKPAIVTIVKWKLSDYCIKNLNAKIEYDDILIKNGSLIIKNVRLNGKEIRYNFSAHQANIDYSILFSQKKIHFDISLDNPTLETEFPSFPVFDFSPKKISFFLLTVTLQVKNGAVEFLDNQDKLRSIRSINVFLKGLTTHRGQSLILNFDSSDDENSIEIKTHFQPDQTIFDFNFNDVKLSNFYNSFRLFDLSILNEVQIANGVLSGLLCLNIPQTDEGMPYFDGELEFSQLNANFANLELFSAVKLAKLIFHKKEKIINLVEGSFFEKIRSSTNIQLKILEESSLAFQKDGEPYWNAKNLLGNFEWQENNLLKFEMKGMLFSKSSQSSLNTEGTVSLQNDIYSLSLGMNLQGPSQVTSSDISAELKYYPDTSKTNIKTQFFNLDTIALQLLKEGIRINIPAINDVLPLKASVDGDLDLTILEGKIKSVKINNLLVKDTEFSSLDNYYRIGKLAGSGQLKFDRESNLDLSILDADIKSEKINFFSKKQNIQFVNDLLFEMSVNKGFMNSLKMEGKFSGLNTKLELNDATKQSPLNLFVSGKTKNLTSFMSNELVKHFTNDLQESDFELNLTAFDQEATFASKGEIIVYDKNKDEKSDKFVFSCSLQQREQTIENFAGIRSFPLFVETIKTLFPFSIDKIQGKFILNGNLSANAMPLDRYVDPFLKMKNDELSLSGYADLEGHLKDGVLVLNYRPFDAVLENQYLKISFCNENSTDLNAVHRIDFLNRQYSGLLPLKQTTYLDKVSSVLFSNLSSSVYFENNAIHCTDVKAKTENIVVSANIDIDFENDDYTNLEMHFNKSFGDVQEIFKFISHFDSSSFWTLPLNGKIDIGDNGFYLKSSFLNDEILIDSHMIGEFSNGFCNFNNKKLSLNEINAKFEYDTSQTKLEVKNMNASLSVEGDDCIAVEHAVSSVNPIELNFQENHLNFDFSLDDQKFSPIRIAGDLFYESDDFQKVDFIFNPLSHFGDLYPRCFELSIEKNKIAKLQFNSDVNLSKLETYLTRLDAFGFPLRPKNFLVVPLLGKLHTELNFCAKEKLLNFDLNGVNIKLGKHKFNEILINGQRCYNNIKFKEFKLDELNLTADLTKWEDRLSINSMKVKYGNYINSHLHGEYFLLQKSMHAQVDNLTVNLNEAILPWLPGFNHLFPTGIAEAKGDAILCFNNGLKFPSIDSNMQMTIDNFKLKNIPIKLNKPIRFRLSPENNYSIEDADFTFAIEDRDEKVNLNKLNYNWNEKKWKVENCNFAFSLDSLSKLMGSFGHHLSYENKSNIYFVLEKLGSNDLSGTIEELNYDKKLSFVAKLDSNNYSLLNRQHTVKDFSVNYKDSKIGNSILYSYRDEDYLVRTEIDLNAKSNSLFFGTSHISENNEIDNKSSLVCLWQWGKRKGFSVNRVDGACAGIKAVLVKSHSPIYNHAIGLVGKVEINFAKAAKLFKKKYVEKIKQLKLGKGYLLNGYFYCMNLDDPNLFFGGDLSGRNFEFLNNRWALLDANMVIGPNKINIANFVVDDKEGKASCKNLSLTKRLDDWHIDLPLLKVNKFNLRAIKNFNKRLNRLNTFAIESFQLKNLKGPIKNNKDQLLGSGKLKFANIRKKTIEKSLFAIPHEIITTIGFNPALLIPVAGTLSYEIKEGKILFVDLGHSYSKGKRSMFYFADNDDYIPYIDFDGNMDINIQIKQHNIFFKLAELLTISITGNYRHPKYKLSGKKTK